MPAVFADTWYWRALLDRHDGDHARAIRESQRLVRSRTIIVTSEMVLTELLNGFSGAGTTMRTIAVRAIREMRANPNVVIVPQDTELFSQALERFAAYADKEWSHTDCASMLIMIERGIGEVLTHDYHFRQAQFTLLP